MNPPASQVAACDDMSWISVLLQFNLHRGGKTSVEFLASIARRSNRERPGRVIEKFFHHKKLPDLSHDRPQFKISGRIGRRADILALFQAYPGAGNGKAAVMVRHPAA